MVSASCLLPRPLAGRPQFAFSSGIHPLALECPLAIVNVRFIVLHCTLGATIDAPRVRGVRPSAQRDGKQHLESPPLVADTSRFQFYHHSARERPVRTYDDMNA